MLAPLATLAQIHTAVVFRDQAPQESPDGNVRALAIRDLVGASPLSWDALPRVAVEQKYLAHCLQPADVVIPARGDYYRAWLFNGVPESVLPVGQLTIIRTGIGGLLDPGFLVWYLNLKSTQSQLAQMLTGTSIKALTKTALSGLPVNAPPLPEQRRIAEASQVASRIKAIRHRLIELDLQELAGFGSGLLIREGSDA